MNLKFLKEYDIDSSSSRYFENVSQDLVLLTIELKVDKVNFDSRPFHWRCEFGDFPPLDISVDSETGLLKEVTVFIKRKDVRRNVEGSLSKLPVSYGYPLFNTDIWGKHEYYYDEFAEVKMLISNVNLSICKHDCTPLKILKVNEKLEIVIDENSFFAGFILRNLTEAELGFLE